MAKLSILQIRPNEIIKCSKCPIKLKTIDSVYFIIEGATLCYTCADLTYLADHSGEEDWEE